MSVGMNTTYEKQITSDDVLAFAEVSGDHNPLHMDEEFAKNSIFGYGFNQFAGVRSEVKPINEFSDNLRPTGPHNGYAFQLLNYGYVGLVIFLALIIYPFVRLNSYRVSYLVGLQNLLLRKFLSS